MNVLLYFSNVTSPVAAAADASAFNPSFFFFHFSFLCSFSSFFFSSFLCSFSSFFFSFSSFFISFSFSLLSSSSLSWRTNQNQKYFILNPDAETNVRGFSLVKFPQIINNCKRDDCYLSLALFFICEFCWFFLDTLFSP